MAGFRPEIRKIHAQIETVHAAAGNTDDGGPLRKVAVCVVFKNPYAGLG